MIERVKALMEAEMRRVERAEEVIAKLPPLQRKESFEPLMMLTAMYMTLLTTTLQEEARG